MTKHILLVAAFGFFSCYAFATPTVTTGGTTTLNFPAKDLSLFCHVSGTVNDNYTVAWTKTAGTGTVTFSASWGLATTVTFASTGSYTFQCAVTDTSGTGTASVNITVNAASSQTQRYVDPNAANDNGDGTAGSPWQDIREGSTNGYSRWQTINSLLGSGDVIIYFAPVDHGGTNQNVWNPVSGQTDIFNLGRHDNTVTHHLTLDGMSQYTTNGTTWQAYTGTTLFKMDTGTCSGCTVSLGTDGDSLVSNTTVRGFELAGSGGRFKFGGNHSVAEYLNIHDIKVDGATLQTQGAYDSSCNVIGGSTDVTVRNNTINRGYGEGIYIAANYNSEHYGGCNQSTAGDTTSDVLIETNTVRDPGYWGGEGGGMDIKSGIYNLTVRGNTVSFTHYGPGRPCGSATTTAYGIDILGRMKSSTHDSNYLIEGNLIHDTGCGISVASINFITIRNNIIYNADMSGIVLWNSLTDCTTFCTPNNKRVYVYNNTLYKTDLNPDTLSPDVAMEFSNFDDNPTVYNNALVIDQDGTISVDTSAANIVSNYNFFAPNAKPSFEGMQSISQTSTTGIFTNPPSDFRLYTNGGTNSPLYQKGTNLTSTGFGVDFGLNNRPTGSSPWGIGAYDVLH